MKLQQVIETRQMVCVPVRGHVIQEIMVPDVEGRYCVLFRLVYHMMYTCLFAAPLHAAAYC